VTAMSYAERIRRSFEDMRRILELAERPDMDDFTTLFKLVLLGIILVGIIAFTINLAVGALLQLPSA